jgi:hypothetical protein
MLMSKASLRRFFRAGRDHLLLAGGAGDLLSELGGVAGVVEVGGDVWFAAGGAEGVVAGAAGVPPFVDSGPGVSGGVVGNALPGDGRTGPDAAGADEPSTSPWCFDQNSAIKQIAIQIDAVMIVIRVKTSPAFAPNALDPPMPPNAPANPPPRPRCTSTRRIKKIARNDKTNARRPLIEIQAIELATENTEITESLKVFSLCSL